MSVFKLPKEYDLPALEVKSADEKCAIDLMSALLMQFLKKEQFLMPRLKLIKNGLRDYRMISSVMDKLVRKIVATLPDKDIRHVDRMIDNGEVLVRLRPAVHEKLVQTVDADDLETVCSAALRGDCSICIKTGGEVRSCKLRRALHSIAPTEVTPGTCPYKDYE